MSDDNFTLDIDTIYDDDVPQEFDIPTPKGSKKKNSPVDEAHPAGEPELNVTPAVPITTTQPEESSGPSSAPAATGDGAESFLNGVADIFEAMPAMFDASRALATKVRKTVPLSPTLVALGIGAFAALIAVGSLKGVE